MPTTATKSSRRTPKQLKSDGFAALVERIGMADAIRYLQLFDPGSGDYTRERRQWLDRLTPNEVSRFVRKAAQRRPRTASR